MNHKTRKNGDSRVGSKRWKTYGIKRKTTTLDFLNRTDSVCAISSASFARCFIRLITLIIFLSRVDVSVLCTVSGCVRPNGMEWNGMECVCITQSHSSAQSNETEKKRKEKEPKGKQKKGKGTKKAHYHAKRRKRERERERAQRNSTIQAREQRGG